MLFNQKITNFCVTISSSEMKSCISKFVLMINLCIFLRAYQINDFKISWFNSSKQRSFIKFILNSGSDPSLHKIVACSCLTSFSCIVKKTVSECVLECYWISSRAFIEFYNVNESVLSAYKHQVSWILVCSVYSRFLQ